LSIPARSCILPTGPDFREITDASGWASVPLA
jgi:hypothetical protein